MAEASIPVDLLNPGQVFACLGILEIADILLGNARGGFDWTDEADIQFRLEAASEKNPIETTLDFFADAEVCSRNASRLELDTAKWDIPTIRFSDDDTLPFAPPSSPATLTAVLQYSGSDPQLAGKEVEISHWGDNRHDSGRDNVKFWAGAAGYPGAGLARDSLELVKDSLNAATTDPFNLPAEQSSSFRLDWRRDYIPIDIGFSLNAHSGPRFRTVGYPLVELLAAIGLSNARPEFNSKIQYRYGVIGVDRDEELLTPIFLRASLGNFDLPFPRRVFRMNLGWPGKEGQARCITTVFEETN